MSSEPAIVARKIAKAYHLGRTGRTDSLLKVFERRLRHPIRGSGEPRERFLALDDVSFDVAPGEAVGVIGRNGAGKSTLLKILSRITPPTDGYIEMAGSVGSLLEVGTGFHPELTGLENVYLNGTILGMSKRAIDRQLDEIVDFAEVHKFMDTPVKRYSSGMSVRLAFAVAAHLHPEILIVDEVLSVGDAGFQAKCLARMKSVASDEGRTVMYVSHNLVTLEHLCPRTLLLVDGRVAFDGPTDEAISLYLSTIPQGSRSPSRGVFDLSSLDRSARGYRKILKQVTLRPAGGDPAGAVRMGERLQVEIEIEGLDEFPEAGIVVSFHDNTGVPLFKMTSEMVPLHAAHDRRHDETIVLGVPALPLTPGDYGIHLMVIGRDGVLDWVGSAAEFEVSAVDVFGTGYQFAPDEPPFVVRWDWELRPSEPALEVGSGEVGLGS